MLTVSRRWLATLGSAALLASGTAKADAPFAFEQCRSHIPERGTAEAFDPNTPYSIKANKLQAKQGDKAEFSGNVEFAQGQRKLSADHTVLDQQEERLDAKGNVSFADNQLQVKSEGFSANMRSEQANLESAEYQLLGSQGRGEATNLHIDGQDQLSLEKASYTACPPGDTSWEVRAESIDIDSKDEWATARNATVRLFDVPVMYLPYFSYPVGDGRHSGFLFPTISTSTKNGIDVSAPYYWNIAPNYDATITPRYMSKRGLMVESQFRYLFDEQEGKLHVDYLPGDDVTGTDRHLFAWEHEGKWRRHWRVNTEYTRISDDNYFNDLGDKLGKISDNQLLQRGELSYHDSNWYSGVLVQDFQVLGDQDNQPHTLMPQLYFNGSWPAHWQTLSAGFEAEVSNFDHVDDNVYTAQRVHIEPSLRLPYSVPAGFFDAELALLHTYYSQDQRQYNGFQLASSVSRTLPKFSAHGGLNFDRQTSYFGQEYTQTLEPQIKYLYIPYVNQDDIGLYDTAVLQQDYYGLFRDRRYSGLDRIADANQITVGLHTRFLNARQEETMRFSIGQIFYFEPSQVTLLPGSDINTNTTSALAAEFDSKLAPNWFSHAGVQYDTGDKELKKANAAVEWRPEIDKLIQLNYRYSSPDETYVNGVRQDINQVGSHIAWPLKYNVSAVGRYYRDMILDRSVESYVGLQFNACCWGIRLTYQRKLQSTYVDGLPNGDRIGTFDSSVKLEFEIKGLGGDQSRDQEKLLDGGTLKYGRPFYLNN